MDNNDFNNGNNGFNNGYSDPNSSYIPPNNGYNAPNGGSGDSPKTLAIVGFVLSFLIPIAGLIVSGIALSKYKQSATEDGKGFATAGLVIGIVCMAIWVLSIACYGCAICAAVATGY